MKNKKRQIHSETFFKVVLRLAVMHAKTLIGIHKSMSEQHHHRWIPSTVSDQIHALLKLNREKKNRRKVWAV